MLFYLAAITLLLVNTSSSAPTEDDDSIIFTTYDQKQSGKYNIHLSIKDVAIIAVESDSLGGGLGDLPEDYYDYDISDFTVKPIFGIIGDIPPVNATPSIFHSEPTESFELTSPNNTANATDTQTVASNVVVISTTSTTGKPDEGLSNATAVNKTQNVIILSDLPLSTIPATLGSVTILNSNATDTVEGLVVTTKTPTEAELPAKISLEQIANALSIKLTPDAKPNSIASYQALVQNENQHYHPSEIPVQIVVEPLSIPAVRHNIRNKARPVQRIHYKNRGTPAPGFRRITPPHIESVDYKGDHGNVAPAAVQAHHRRNGQANSYRRPCARDQEGRCQTKSSGM